MAAVDISPLKDGGVMKEVLKEGYGKEAPGSGSKVTVHYTGTLLDGTKFDSSKDRCEPFQFDLDKGQVIKAWDIGIATMKKGEVAMLTCDSKYAYGKRGSPPKIPADATLKFEVEMIDFTGEDLSPNSDGSIERFLIQAGKPNSRPADGCLVDVHLIGKYNDAIFEERDVQFPLGEGQASGIVDGIDIALEHFTSGEKSRLKIKSKYAFKKTGNPEFNIPPDAEVEYIVELKTCEKVADRLYLEPSERIEQAKLYKEKGSSYCKSGNYAMAVKMGEKSVKYLDEENVFEDDSADAKTAKTERDSLLPILHRNLALFYLKNNQNAEAKAACDEVLKLDENDEKAHFRRGQALIGLASPQEAIQDFEAVLKIEPKNVAAVKQIAVCKNHIKENIAKEKKLYANMFEKFAQADKQ